MRHKPEQRDNGATDISLPTVAGEAPDRRSMKQSSLPDPRKTFPARRWLRWPGDGGARTLLLAGLLIAPLHGHGQTPAQGSNAARSADPRPPTASLDHRVRRLEETIGALNERLQGGAYAPGGEGSDRLMSALLHLETVVGSGRPWEREWQLILALDGASLVPPLFLEVLGSHASRGLPTARDLADRFEAVAPAISARASSDVPLHERALNAMRSTLAGIGLVAPVEPGQVDTALAGIREHMRRGELPGALVEVALLPNEHQLLLAGWLAQIRARVAVEQALQEVILGLLSGRPRQG